MLLLVIFLVSALVFALLLSVTRNMPFPESFADAPDPLLTILPGPLPEVVSNYLSKTCVITYDSPDLSGPASGCIPPGHHFDGDYFNLIKTAKSFKVPSGYMIQMYSENQESFTTIDNSEVKDWIPPFTIKQFIVFRTDLVQSGRNVPEPALDDRKSVIDYAEV